LQGFAAYIQTTNLKNGARRFSGRKSRMRGMKNCLPLATCVSMVLMACPISRAGTQASPAEGAQQFAELGDLKLQSGRSIQDFRLGYRTLGKLDARKSNAILWPTWLGGKSQDLLEFLGPGKVVDTTKYFVVLIDAIGNGVTTSPSNSKKQPWMSFPLFSIRDMVEAEHRLAVEVLNLTHVHALMGISMGGMQTFEWILTYADFMDVAVSIAGSPQSTAFDKLLWTAQIEAIELDPAWNNGHPTGSLDHALAVAEEIGQMNLTSPAYRVAHTPTKDFDSYLADLKEHTKGDGGVASDQIRQRQAILSLDIPGELGLSLAEAAKRVRAKLLVIVSPQDHLVNPIPAQQFAAAIGAPVITLDSPCGHMSLACISAGPTVAKFLADPATVHSETLHDPANR
jgi:homoserine O-acetyltransferase/O-succinyltransferase